MLTRLWISKPLRQAKIDHIYVMLLFANTNKEVVGLNIPMKKMPRVNKLNPLQHLIRKHQDRLKCEFALAVVQ